MVTHSLSDPFTIINTLTEQLEFLDAYLCKAKALASVMLSPDFIESMPEKLMHNYFWTLCDIIDDAEQFNEACISDWMRKQRGLKRLHGAKAAVTAEMPPDSSLDGYQ